MDQLLPEKDRLNVKICFEEFLISEGQQKYKNLSFQNLYQYIQFRHFEINKKQEQKKTDSSFFGKWKQKKEDYSKQNKKADDAQKKKKKISSDVKEFHVFQVTNANTDISYFVRVKSVFLDCPLIMIIFENLEIVKSNNKLKKQMEINNILNTCFFFEVSKKCELIKWAIKEKETHIMQLLFSLLQNNIYSIRKNQEKKQKEFNTSPLLKKKGLDFSNSQSQIGSPNLKFSISKGSEIHQISLEINKLFSCMSTYLPMSQDQKASIINMKQSIGQNVNKQQAVGDITSFIKDKKSFSIDVDKHLTEDSCEQESNSIFKNQSESYCDEITLKDIKQRKQMEQNYEFQNIYKNSFKKTSSFDEDKAYNQDDLHIKSEQINLNFEDIKTGQDILFPNSAQKLSQTIYITPATPFNSVRPTPIQTQFQQSKSNNTVTSFHLQSPYSQSYSRSVEYFKSKNKSGHHQSPVYDQNKKSFPNAVQDILLNQINYTTSQNEKPPKIMTNNLFLKNYQHQSTTYLDRENTFKDKEYCSYFEFSELVQELYLYSSMLVMQFDTSLKGLKIYNDKEAIIYILKSFFSSIVIHNYLRRKQIINQIKNENFEKDSILDQEQVIKSHEQLRMYAFSLRDNSIKNKRASYQRISTQPNISQKIKDNSFLQSQNQLSLPKNQKSSSMSPTHPNFKIKIHSLRQDENSIPSNRNKQDNTIKNPDINNNTISPRSCAEKYSFHTELNKCNNSFDEQSINNPPNFINQSACTINKNKAHQSNVDQDFTSKVDQDFVNNINQDIINKNKKSFSEDVRVEFQLETKQHTKSILIKLTNIDKEDLVNCLNFNSNIQISKMEYENIKDLIQKIGPSPLYHEDGKIIFAFLVDINQVIGSESPRSQYKQQKSETIQDNLVIIPEEQELARNSLIKLNSAV